MSHFSRGKKVVAGRVGARSGATLYTSVVPVRTGVSPSLCIEANTSIYQRDPPSNDPLWRVDLV